MHAGLFLYVSTHVFVPWSCRSIVIVYHWVSFIVEVHLLAVLWLACSIIFIVSYCSVGSGNNECMLDLSIDNTCIYTRNCVYIIYDLIISFVARHAT